MIKEYKGFVVIFVRKNYLWLKVEVIIVKNVIIIDAINAKRESINKKKQKIKKRSKKFKVKKAKMILKLEIYALKIIHWYSSRKMIKQSKINAAIFAIKNFLKSKVAVIDVKSVIMIDVITAKKNCSIIKKRKKIMI
jgi:hypothetical protein